MNSRKGKKRDVNGSGDPYAITPMDTGDVGSPRRLTAMERFKRGGGLAGLGLTFSRTGHWYQKGIIGSISSETALGIIAKATGTRVGSEKFNEILEYAIGKGPKGDPDRLWWNKMHSIISEVGKYKDDKKRSRTGEKIKTITMFKMMIALNSEDLTGRPKEEWASVLKKKYGGDSMFEAFENFMNTTEAGELTRAVMGVDQAILEKFGLSAEEIDNIRKANEEERYKILKDLIAVTK